MAELLTATIHTRANIHFDGKVISHTLEMADGSKKTLGVLLPSTFTFTPGESEVMEILEGHCRMRRADSDAWVSRGAGDRVDMPQGIAFDIAVERTVHYVCHFE